MRETTEHDTRCVFTTAHSLTSNYFSVSPYMILSSVSLSQNSTQFEHIFFTLHLDERNILDTAKRRKANWIGHILRRNCLLKHVIREKIKGQIEVTGRRGGRRKQLLDDLKEARGYLKLEEEALDRTLWGTRLWKRLWTCRKAEKKE